MRFFPFRAALAVILAAAPFVSNVSGQILYGSAVGNVKDASDAAVGGATVTITNTQTNQSRETVTNETGAYSVPTLEPGTYTIRVAKPGFSAYSATNVSISINSVTRVDVTLAVGAVNETISVSALSSALQT